MIFEKADLDKKDIDIKINALDAFLLVSFIQASLNNDKEFLKTVTLKGKEIIREISQDICDKVAKILINE